MALDEDHEAKIQSAADRVLELDAELETSGNASVGGTELERAQAILHAWIDEAKAVVVNAGLGRVTIIHGNGRPSTIASADLPFRLSKPI